MADRTGTLDISFTATLGKVRPGDTWTCVQLTDSAAIFGTRGLVKVAGTIDGCPFQSSFMAVGRRDPQAPRFRSSAKAIGKNDGDEVTVHLTARLNWGLRACRCTSVLRHVLIGGRRLINHEAR